MIIGNEKGSLVGEEREKHRDESIMSKEVSMKQYEQERFPMKRVAANWRNSSVNIMNEKKKLIGLE
jgi:hypothetical protein|tara:strand:+ start:1340 stop:1537 length:198 start_codon:yes stop_codon:yes gene_type:complete